MKIFFTLIILIILASCNETTNVTNTSEEFLPLTIGNYWIFKSFETNINENIIKETINEDSLVIVGTEIIDGVTANILIKYRDNKPIDTMYLTEDKNIIFRLYDSTKIKIPHLTNHWFPIIDYNVKKDYSWNIYNTAINNYPYELNDTVYLPTYQHTYNGTFVSDDSLTFNGTKFPSKKYYNKYDSRLTFQIKKRIEDGNGNYHYDSLDYTRTLKYFDYYHLAEGIGFFKIERKPYTLYISTSPSSTYNSSENFNGFVSELKRYFINN